jgi:hypothetical protein
MSIKEIKDSINAGHGLRDVKITDIVTGEVVTVGEMMGILDKHEIRCVPNSIRDIL